jgi:predicted DNA-binding transcriptional regulator YafY
MSSYCGIITVGDVKTMKDNRLFRILYYILEKGKVTANELADKFEVSVRTIYRDIDSISSAGIPIYALQGKGGGIEIAEDFVLSKSLLSENEKQQIMSALQGLDNTTIQRENELLTKLSALFKMKNTSWIEVDFNNWQNNKMYEKTFNDIKSAILSKNIISFTYFSSNEKETDRSVKPVRLLFKSQDWYLYALCLLRNDFRYFKLSRIKNLEIHTEKFDDNFEDAILKKEMPHENTVHIKVKFDRKVAFRVYDELNGEIIEDDEGNLYAEIEIPNDYNLYNYIFSFGDGAEVLEPKEIRMQIKEMINKMAEKYIT